MYFEVGAFDSAKTYIDRYLSVRESSAVAHRFKGKLMEALNMKDKALISCKHAYELDPSISDTLLTIARLLTQVLPFDIEEAHSTEWRGLWTLNEKSSVLPSNFFSTPKTQSQRRFPPRPSPERLSAQFKQLESKQESSLAHLDERLAELEEKDEAILKILNDIMYEVRQGKTISQNISTEMTMLKKDLKDRDELRMTDITSAVAATSAAVTSLQQQQQHIQLAPREPDEDISLLKQKLKEAEKHAAIQQAAFSATCYFRLWNWCPSNNNAPTNIVISSSDKIPVVGKDPVPSFSGSVTIPPEHRLGVKPTMPIISPTAPMASSHSFQINLSHGGQKNGVSFQESRWGPAVSITTTALLSKIPDPIYSAVDTPTDHGHTSINRQRQTSVNSNYTDDDDHDPCPDFKPIIPLPEEVDVVTGEEEESTLFEDRSKLYRFVDKEWKERGIGQLKILKHNATGKIRVIMRRDQTLKICANHHVLPDIHIEKMMNQDKAVTWFANDFTDEEVRMENFSARFKTPEQADKFLAAFNDAKKAVRVFINSFKERGSVIDSNNTTKISLLCGTITENEEDKMRCVACQTVQPGKENLAVESEAKSASTPVISFGTGGGFSFKTNSTTTPITTSASSVFSSLPLTSLDTSVSPFSSTYTIIPAATTESKSSVFSSSFTTTPVTTSSSSTISVFSSFNATPTAVTSTSVTETSKASPFSNFSFGADSSNFSSVFNFTTPKSETEKSATPFVGVVGSKVETFSFGKLNVSNNSLVNPPVENANAITNKSLSESKNESYADEEEHDPCPDFKPIIPLPEEIEVVTGEEDEDILFEARSKLYRFVINEWKERGIGQLKILRQKTTKKVRILMRRDQTLKVCANHFLMPEIIAERMKKKDNAFKTADIATQFIEAFDNAKANIPIGSPKKNVAKVDSSKVSEVETLGSLDKFKPEAGSWECPGCMCRNKANDIKCPACETIQPGKEGPKTPEKTISCIIWLHLLALYLEKLKTASTNPYKPPSEVADEMELSFENKSLKLNSAEDAKEVADKISSTKVMHTLTLSGNTIGIEAARALGKALETHPEFRRAHWKDMFTGRMKTEIPPALTHLSNGNNDSQRSISRIGLDQGHATLLKELRLNNTGCGVTGGKHLADLLTKCLDNSTEMGAALALRVFVLGRSRQENDGCNSFGQGVQENEELGGGCHASKCLKELHMDSNEITEKGGLSIVDAIANKKELTCLSIDSNQFGEDGCKSVLEQLKKNWKRESNYVNESNEHESPKNNDNIFGGDSNIFSSLNGSKTQNLFGAATANNQMTHFKTREDAGSPSKTDSKPSIPFSFGATKTEKDGVGGQEAGGGLFKSTNLPSLLPSPLIPTPFSLLIQSGANTSRGVGEDPDESEHDPHFEPIIPLPELVVVSTGEEEEKVMFSHRSKVYRYETDTKEWKEREEIKRLKFAVNHLISEDMVLKPLITSETALCWFAMDYSDEEKKLNASFKKDSSNTIVESSCGESTDLSIPDEEGSCVNFRSKDYVRGRTIRIFATQEDDDFVCNHYIMEDMTLNIDDNVCTWSAEDLIYEDSCVRSFKAVFDNDQDANDFKDTFYEGRDSAYDYVPVEQF
ncbi:RANBP2 [Lepeophtheirus salmonis]|uniref:Nuclear pore complex protein Nup153 n=1 Tax=Lepeophtheirus salmonis TaxID=72036 RepID=A0A7R8CSA7_LEPSM|nr:RANBP2 [Lepeophtheirus salmonis]CAF2862703.1 RANBP2 [Lepeophtheirus salmonis]